MSIKVTIRNYNFPITFTHKGWNVKLTKRIGLFKDIAVDAQFSPLTAYQSIEFERNMLRSLIENGTINVSHNDYDRYVATSDSYLQGLKYPTAFSKSFSANGGLMDRFLGQNISATENLVNKVVSYMDSSLPIIAPFNSYEYLNHLRNRGLHSSLYAVIVKLHGLCR